jgi:hypothetical protein
MIKAASLVETRILWLSIFSDYEILRSSKHMDWMISMGSIILDNVFIIHGKVTLRSSSVYRTMKHKIVLD